LTLKELSNFCFKLKLKLPQRPHAGADIGRSLEEKETKAAAII